MQAQVAEEALPIRREPGVGQVEDGAERLVCRAYRGRAVTRRGQFVDEVRYRPCRTVAKPGREQAYRQRQESAEPHEFRSRFQVRASPAGQPGEQVRSLFWR